MKHTDLKPGNIVLAWYKHYANPAEVDLYYGVIEQVGREYCKVKLYHDEDASSNFKQPYGTFSDVCTADIQEIVTLPAATPSPLPETAKTVKTESGEVLKMNEEETEVMYKGEWYSIQEDQDGEFYFLSHGEFGDIVFYIEMPESEAPPTGKTDTGVSIEEMCNLEDDIHGRYPTPGNEREGEGIKFGTWTKEPGMAIVRFNEFARMEITVEMENVKSIEDCLWFTQEGGEAFCSLIAAAPDMFRTLKEILRFNGAINKAAESLQYPDNFLNAMKNAESIINSITGGK